MWNKWHVCVTKIVSMKIFEDYRTHTSDYCVRTVLLRISPPVYSVKILGRNKTSKYYVTFDGGESYQLKSKIDRGSIYYPFLFAHTNWQIEDILIVTTFFGCKIFVHKSCHYDSSFCSNNIYKQYKLLICKFSWVEGVYAVSIETLPPYGVIPFE